MDRLSPISEPEPSTPASAGSTALRTTAYAALAAMLIGGAWVRFNDRIAAFSPTLAGPAAAVSQQAADETRMKGLFELPMLSEAASPQAVAGMGLPKGEATALAADVQRDRLRLVQLPLFDAGAAPGLDAITGRSVEVSSGGFTRLVHLTRQPTLVTLPINRVGTVSFRVADAGPAASAVGIGALTLSGPVRLPDLSTGEELDVGVVAQ